MRSVLKHGVALAALAVVTSQAPAFAQENNGSEASDKESYGLNVITVTAQRRSESVQSVPIAVSAFDSAELATRGVSNALELAQFVPNLVGINNTGLGSANAYYMRGLGNTESIPTFDPPIGTYVDDIYLSRQNANNLSLFDVERVEVLRGPQGTLFGRNTTGGAVAVFLKDPEPYFGGRFEAGYGAYNKWMASGSIDIPLSDRFATKVSAYYQESDGYAKNTTTGERQNNDDGWGVRLGLHGDLSDTAVWKGSYIHTYADGANIANFDCDPADPSNCAGRFVTTGFRKNGDFDGLLTGKKDGFGQGVRTTMDFISSNLKIGTDDLSVSLITGYVYTTQDFALDFADGRGLPSLNTPITPVLGYTYGGFTVANEGEFSQFSQEIKVNATVADGLLDLVGGVYYFEEDNFSDFADIFTISSSTFPAPDGLPLILADRTMRNSTRAYAAYFQGDINVTDRVKLTAGVRYTDETKRVSFRDNRASCNDGTLEATCLDSMNMVVPNGTDIPHKQNVKIWTPRFAANFQVTPDVLLFASATRGFKSGGWNARGTSPAELLPFDPEKAWSYEAGVKSELFDRKLRVNLSAYWLDVSDLQTPSGFVRSNGSIGFVTRNFADYRNKGVELEVSAVPARGLNVFASFGYQGDKYLIDMNDLGSDEYGVQSVATQLAVCQAQLEAGLVPGGDATACGQGIVAPDGTLSSPVRTPEFNFALGASYEIELNDEFTLKPSINASWRDNLEVGTSNVTYYDDPVTSTGGAEYANNLLGNGALIAGSASSSRWIVNATLALANENGWTITAECQNCLDQEAVESTLANLEYLNPPRTWMIKGRFEF